MINQPPTRDNLCRSVPFEVVRADSDENSDGLTIEGYGAVFNSATQIDSWEGSFEETIASGAFRKSLRERSPKMQFDHGRHPLLGSLPLGRWETAEEDERGLHVIGRMTNNWLIQPFRDAIADGGVEGMSFRFSVVREEWRDNSGKLVKDTELSDLLWSPGGRGPLQRTLKEVRVSEVGPVMWPAYESTTVGVRSLTIDLGNLTDPDQRNKLATAVLMADAANRSNDAPRTTQDSDRHPSPDAPPADDASGEHPSDHRPVNPTERAAFIRHEYRTRLDRLLALSQSTDK